MTEVGASVVFLQVDLVLARGTLAGLGINDQSFPEVREVIPKGMSLDVLVLGTLEPQIFFVLQISMSFEPSSERLVEFVNRH